MKHAELIWLDQITTWWWMVIIILIWFGGINTLRLNPRRLLATCASTRKNWNCSLTIWASRNDAAKTPDRSDKAIGNGTKWRDSNTELTGSAWFTVREKQPECKEDSSGWPCNQIYYFARRILSTLLSWMAWWDLCNHVFTHVILPLMSCQWWGANVGT